MDYAYAFILIKDWLLRSRYLIFFNDSKSFTNAFVESLSHDYNLSVCNLIALLAKLVKD